MSPVLFAFQDVHPVAPPTIGLPPWIAAAAILALWVSREIQGLLAKRDEREAAREALKAKLHAEEDDRESARETVSYTRLRELYDIQTENVAKGLAIHSKLLEDLTAERILRGKLEIEKSYLQSDLEEERKRH